MVDEKKPEVFIKYELRVKENRMEVTLSASHRTFLKYLGTVGGECPFDYSKLTERARAHIKHLPAMDLISETPIIGTRDTLLRLTDFGRNILTEILKSEQ